MIAMYCKYYFVHVFEGVPGDMFCLYIDLGIYFTSVWSMANKLENGNLCKIQCETVL